MFSTISQPAFTLIGVQTRIQDPETAPGIIGAAWEAFLDEKMFDKIPHALKKQELYAVYHDYDGAGGYSLFIGNAVKPGTQTPHGMKNLIIPEQRYAHTQVQGLIPPIVIETWQKIWNSDLKRTFTFDIELYRDRLQQDKEHTVDFFIAVQ